MKHRKRKTLAISSILLVATVAAHAQSADALIDKLVEKGILTVKEANDLREEADKNFSQAHSVKSGMPEWVTSLKFAGDFRGRFGGTYSENPDFVDRNRWRYRLRYGVTATLLEDFEVGFRLGSGDLDAYPGAGLDPISQNQTLQNNGSKKGIFIDLAYARWSPLNTTTMQGGFTIGKMENPFVFTDLVFDHDYTPEGFGLQWGYTVAEGHLLKLNGGAFVLDEIGASARDPYLFGAQVEYGAALSKKLSVSTAVAALGITSAEQLRNNRVPNVNVGNTRDSNGAPVYDFHPVVADAWLTYTFDSAPYYTGAFPIRVGGEYMYNGGAPSSADNEGWGAGIGFGKAGKKKTWEVSYMYKWLGANSWWEELVDSDFGAFWTSVPANANMFEPGYASGTNIRGHIVRLAYAPYDFLTLSAKWFYTDIIETDFMVRQPPPEGTSRTHRIQIDAVFKF